MGITMIATGGVPGNRSVLLFSPKGALTHHRATGPAVVAFPVARPARSPRGIALSTESARQCCRDCGPGHHCLRGGDRRADPSACENLHPASLSQRQGESKRIALLSLWRKEKQKKDWR